MSYLNESYGAAGDKNGGPMVDRRLSTFLLSPKIYNLLKYPL